jgi:hypothetical protein
VAWRSEPRIGREPARKPHEGLQGSVQWTILDGVSRPGRRLGPDKICRFTGPSGWTLAGLEPATSRVRCGNALTYIGALLLGVCPDSPLLARSVSGPVLQGILGVMVRADGCADQWRCDPGGRTVLLGA